MLSDMNLKSVLLSYMEECWLLVPKQFSHKRIYFVSEVLEQDITRCFKLASSTCFLIVAIIHVIFLLINLNST